MNDKWMKINIALVVLILLFFMTGVGLYTDWLWFMAVGYSSVFLKILWTRIAVGVVAGALFFIFAYINAVIANKPYYAPASEYEVEGEEQAPVIGEEQAPVIDVETPSKLFVIPIAALAVFFGLIASTGWDTILLYLNRVPFGIVEPLLSKDIGFYVFTLPLYEFLWNALFYSVLLTGAVTILMYLIRSKAILLNYTTSEVKFETPKFTSNAKMHLSFLGGLIFLLFAVKYKLNIYQLLYSTRGVVAGATYTDVNAQLPILKLLIAVAVFGALILFANMKFKDAGYAVAAVILLFGVSFLGNSVYPGLIQQYRVRPNELKFEAPYIARNIEYTRRGYGLADVEEKDFLTTYNLTWDDIQNNRRTIENIRLWDNRPLKDTYRQLQEIRLYYDFRSVDIDRYIIDGEYRQVMLSVRELNQDQLKQEAQTWVNKRLVYTHGYGIAMSPVNRISEEGLPEFIIKDIPPESEHITIERPEIYYGEETGEYVIVNTKQEEFDYPMGDENVMTTYKGDGGVVLSSVFSKGMMAARFGTPDMLLNRDITRESRIMFHRDIGDRVRVIAPFLKYDGNPYPLISDGKILWIQDAYTTSQKYPYSTQYPAPWQSPYFRVNYIRNSVKVVIDAYDGKVTYYVADQNDPIIKAWAAVFPKLFRPISEMPEETLMHIRYPEDLFRIQTETYAKYHMENPGVFYNQEDLWSIPTEQFGRQEQLVEPYYIIMKLPEEEREEFILMLPFTPLEKDNMIAWMFARSDQPGYGKLGLYKFGKKELIYGPMQIEARIDQDEEISEQLTLWGQRGSEVIRGNLLVIPIEDSILYVEPLYLQAERGKIPELKRVIVVYGPKLAMKEDLMTALAELFEVAPAAIEVKRVSVGVEANLTREDLTASALAHYEQAQLYLTEGNWAGYGQELEALKEDLLWLKESP